MFRAYINNAFEQYLRVSKSSKYQEHIVKDRNLDHDLNDNHN